MHKIPTFPEQIFFWCELISNEMQLPTSQVHVFFTSVSFAGGLYLKDHEEMGKGEWPPQLF
jgi:hypothetical protein